MSIGRYSSPEFSTAQLIKSSDTAENKIQPKEDKKIKQREYLLKEINNLIEKTKKKLVILIDDIDRLQPDEILLVFKLVKAELWPSFSLVVILLHFHINFCSMTSHFPPDIE